MTLLEHFKDPNFWQIFFTDLSIFLGLVAIFVSICWLLDKIKVKPDLATRLNAQKLWQKRFKK